MTTNQSNLACVRNLYCTTKNLYSLSVGVGLNLKLRLLHQGRLRYSAYQGPAEHKLVWSGLPPSDSITTWHFFAVLLTCNASFLIAANHICVYMSEQTKARIPQQWSRTWFLPVRHFHYILCTWINFFFCSHIYNSLHVISFTFLFNSYVQSMLWASKFRNIVLTALYVPITQMNLLQN